MLSVLQQKAILMMWINQNRDIEQCMDRGDFKVLYKGRTSFYHSISYLIRAGIVEKSGCTTHSKGPRTARHDRGKDKCGYRLTMAGALLAKIFCAFPDVPSEFGFDKTYVDVLLKWRM